MNKPTFLSVCLLAAPLLLGAASATKNNEKEAKMQIIHSVPYHPEFGERGLGDLYLPENPGPSTPVALSIHGGAWVAMDKSSFAGVAEFLCRQGFAVYNIQYRYATTAPWPGIGDDCLEAARFVLDGKHPALAGLDRSKLLVVGASAGGHLALVTGLRLPADKVLGIVSISGVADPEADYKVKPDLVKLLWGKAPTAAELAAAAPATYAGKDGPPVLCTHAYFDTVVPFSSSAGFVEKARAKGERVEFYGYDRANDGHCIWIPGSSPHRLHPDIEDAIKAFVGTLRP